MVMPTLNNVGFRFVPNDSAAMDSEIINGRDQSHLIDFIDGGGGDDIINGHDGSDALIGGLGEDTLAGGAGGNMDLLVGGVLDSVQGADLQQLLADAIAATTGLDPSQVLGGLVDILDNAENLQDVVMGISDAAGSSSEVQQMVGAVLQAVQENFTWEQDVAADSFEAASSSEENGVDIIFGFNDDESSSGDLIDFSDALSLNAGSQSGKENQLTGALEYDPLTGALTDDQDHDWFFVYTNINPLNPDPADTVQVEVDGDLFLWNTSTDSWDMMAVA